MQPSHPVTRDLILIGGGHAHALVLRKWGMSPLPGVRVTLITPEPTAPYTGMLPGHVAGHYSRHALDIDLMRLARFAGARVVLKSATGLDLNARQVIVPDRAPVAFDALSINVGIRSTLPDLPGFAEHAIPAKPLGLFADRWARFVEAVEKGEVEARIAVIGCGVAGAELALSMHHRLRDHAPEIVILEAEDALKHASPRARAALERNLRDARITIREGVQITRIAADHVETQAGDIPSNFTVGAAGATPLAWVARTGLPVTDGFIEVGEHLNSPADPTIFAGGDCAHMLHAPREKAGVFAVRQAPILHHNLRATLSGKRLKGYKPQRDYLKLVSLGTRDAVADWHGLAPSGPLLWRWKDHIDSKFMRKFDDLPAMNQSNDIPAEAADGLAEMIAAQPMCGGCGAKVGAATLRRQIEALPAPHRPDIAEGAGDDAALLIHGAGFQTFTTDHFRAFIDDPWLLTRIAVLHALGDVWAMGGQPQAALSQIILPRMAEKAQADTLREIMDAASTTLRDAGADLVGGHTSLGAELTVGFSVTGLVERPIRLSGAQTGDALILTKPIGTGTILAADMQAQAPGHSVAAALTSMSLSSARAAAILSPLAHAMTDVTGFGLAGHLFGILDLCGLSADLNGIPLIDGALALAEAGHRSSLFTQNTMRIADVIGPAGPLKDLLFDPQTSGGLLAAIPAGEVSTTLSALTDSGYTAAHIGTLSDGPARIRIG